MSYKEMGYKLYEASVNVWRNNNGIKIHNIAINTSLYDGSCSYRSEEECKMELASITPSDEYEKIWKEFDYQAIQNVCNSIKPDPNADEFHAIIKSCEEFESTLKKIGIYGLYLKEKESLDKKRKLLERRDLIEVKFRKYQSWETGLCFLILNERVDKKVFSSLMKGGLYYHKADEDNEELFTGWCIVDREMNRLKLAENGIKIV